MPHLAGRHLAGRLLVALDAITLLEVVDPFLFPRLGLGQLARRLLQALIDVLEKMKAGLWDDAQEKKAALAE